MFLYIRVLHWDYFSLLHLVRQILFVTFLVSVVTLNSAFPPKNVSNSWLHPSKVKVKVKADTLILFFFLWRLHIPLTGKFTTIACMTRQNRTWHDSASAHMIKSSHWAHHAEYYAGINGVRSPISHRCVTNTFFVLISEVEEAALYVRWCNYRLCPKEAKINHQHNDWVSWQLWKLCRLVQKG